MIQIGALTVYSEMVYPCIREAWRRHLWCHV